MNKIKVVLVAPNMNPRVIELNNTYNDVSDMFGNNCLGIKYLRDDTILIFDDMCNCKNLKFNRCFGDNINLSYANSRYFHIVSFRPFETLILLELIQIFSYGDFLKTQKISCLWLNLLADCRQF